ncbi:MAG TPA: Uma2 family endonuclease [Vicinamibacteria bacterium]|nr:Uma2 family endonuclease [Vicinamibacteria bacterium]
MATTPTSLQERVLLTGISWQTYERLLAEHLGRSSPRFTYDRGELEIMVLSFEHEEINRLVADVFAAIADASGIDFVNAGSTTLKRRDLERGFEPDTCFYVANAPSIRGKKKLDLPDDPPPDLVIEIDITSSSLDKMGIYAAMRVPEVWRYDGKTVRIFGLRGETYDDRSTSGFLPGVTFTDLTRFVEKAQTTPRSVWLRQVRDWVERAQGRR